MRMESTRNAPEETATELCERAETEQDLDKLLELVSRLQRLVEARRSKAAEMIDGTTIGSQRTTNSGLARRFLDSLDGSRSSKLE
jgi:hypothetical protein